MRETPLHIMAKRCCEGVRRDRRDALYVAREVFGTHAFRVQARADTLLALYMTRECVAVLSAWLPAFPEDDLYVSLLRLRQNEPGSAELSFLTQCVKWFETGCAFPARTERELRQLCAVCLRTKTGGGALYLARALMLMGG